MGRRRSDLPDPVPVGDWTASVMSSKGQRDGLWLWYARHRDRKAHKAVSLGRIKRRDVARVLLTRLEERQADQREQDRGGRLETWADACAYWSGHQQQRHARGRIQSNTLRNYRTSAKHIKAVVGHMSINARIQTVADTYAELSPYAATVQRIDLAAIASMHRWLASVGICQLTPYETPLPKPTPRKGYTDRVPSEAEVWAVLAKVPRERWAHGAILLLYATGLRPMELAKAREEDADWWPVLPPPKEGEKPPPAVGFLRVGIHEGARKTGEREVPVMGPALEWAREYLAPPRPGGQLWEVSHRAFKSGLWYVLQEACEAAGVERFSPKGLRKLAITMGQEHGLSDFAHEAIFGNSPKTGREVYAQRRRQALRDAAIAAALGKRDTG